MRKTNTVWAPVGTAIFAGVIFSGILSGQAPAKVDYARDVAPVFRQNCAGCHGPTQQLAGLRLDRKSSVMKAGLRRVVAGSSENSFLYYRLIGNEYGPQMPPTGPLRPEQIAMLKTWIDQGADWPESLANEADLPPLNPKAVAMVEMLRTGDLPSFLKQAAEDPKLLNSRGPEGSTPFMYAVLYANASTLADLLKLGADPNKRNDGNATALLWAAADLEKTRVLLDHAADVNARSDELRTPLMAAARHPGGTPIVKLLLDHGAKVNPNAHPGGESSPLTEAATAGDVETVQLLLKHGADAKAAGQQALSIAIQQRCLKCLELIAAKNPDRAAYTGALQETAVLADAKSVRLLLDHGADVNAYDPFGRTPLMNAAASDALPLDVVKLLVSRGADVNAKNRHTKAGDAGTTVLDIAKFHGDTPITEFLVKSGAKGNAVSPAVLHSKQENSLRAAIQESLPLLQRADANFSPKAGCISCHNNSLTAMTVGLARRRQIRVDETIAAQQVKANVQSLEASRERMHQGFLFTTEDNFGALIVGYMLLGLGAENYKADLNTDAAAMYLKTHQMADGQWSFPVADPRPPICSVYIGQTAISMRALQLYAPKTDRDAYDKAIQLAASWLAKAQPITNDDRGWKLMGLSWAGTDQVAKQKAMQDLLAAQKTDGGWPDIASMESTAYSTGRALVALQAAGLPVSDAAYQRGVRFLLSTQQSDGSWFVKTRALAFQPYFDAGFPHGYNQWISTAATGWAAMALTLALPEGGPAVASRFP